MMKCRVVCGVTSYFIQSGEIVVRLLYHTHVGGSSINILVAEADSWIGGALEVVVINFVKGVKRLNRWQGDTRIVTHVY